MVDHLPALNQLLRQLQQVPYLASKNLYKVADHFLRMNAAQIQHFCDLLVKARDTIVLCERCFSLKERGGNCIFCASPKRNQGLICVVETWHDLYAIEKTEGYTGVYHVLGGVISPLDGVGPEDLTIDQLIKRAENEMIEVILATNQTPEGEATAAFIAKQLRSRSVAVSCLARGLPVGSSLGAMDRVTVCKAILERRPF